MNSKKKDILETDEIQEGIFLCIQNANDILNDCKLLKRRKRYARAMALAITCLEEIGKINLLRTINRIPANKQKLCAIKWKAFYKHNYKSSVGIITSFPDYLRKCIKAFTIAAVKQIENAPICEKARQLGLYTDYSEADNSWVSPRVISKELANAYYQIAKEALNRINFIAEKGLFSTRVLEIEKEVYENVYQNIPDDKIGPEAFDKLMRLAHIKAKEFYTRLVDEGIISENDIHILI